MLCLIWESIQLINGGFTSYFEDVWNFFDCTNIALETTVSVIINLYQNDLTDVITTLKLLNTISLNFELIVALKLLRGFDD
jgi:hypothetical protein